MKDIVSRVALLVLICLLIIYAGFTIKNLLVKRQLNLVNKANNELVAQFPALEQYQQIYDNLRTNEGIYQSIKPKGVSSTEFISRVVNEMPSYVHIKSITLQDWFLSGICELDCVTSSYEDVFDCLHMFEGKDYISSAVTNELTKQYNADDTVTVTFKLALATTGTLTSDGKAQVVTEAPTAPPETNESGETVTETTTAAEGDTTTAAAEG